MHDYARNADLTFLSDNNTTVHPTSLYTFDPLQLATSACNHPSIRQRESRVLLLLITSDKPGRYLRNLPNRPTTYTTVTNACPCHIRLVSFFSPTLLACLSYSSR